MSMLERRSTPRLSASQPGEVVLPDASALKCQIRNVAQTGARIRLNEIVALPSTFALRILAAGRTEPAELIWQNGDSVGVRFLSGRN